MGIRDWAQQRWDVRAGNAAGSEYVEWVANLRALDGEQVSMDLDTQMEWMRETLRELGATDDVFGVLADLEKRAIAFGVLLGDLAPR